MLINGASGGVGTFAVQIARAFGAEVTGVCSSRNVDLVESMGADHVIDYTREDFTRNGHRYDLILDNVGNHPLSETRRALAISGTLIYNSGRAGFGPIVQVNVLRPIVRHKLRFFIAKFNAADMTTLAQLMESGKVTPAIDELYPLGQSARAVAHVGAGHTRGKVVITI